MMEKMMFKHFLFALLSVFSLILVHAQDDQSGFISIDCGRVPPNTSYTEPSTGIKYISDELFVDGGVSKSILPEYKATLQEQAAYVRSFPEGIRNCYRVNVTKNTRYLIRATFLYGDYDGLEQFPEFDLHFGVTLWETVKIEYITISAIKEIIHIPTQDKVDVCLVNTGSGTPFITALEFRPLLNSTYSTPIGSLLLYLRADVGSTDNGSVHRYPFDVFDRLWFPYYYEKWTQIQLPASEKVNSGFNIYQPSPDVMGTAGTPTNESSPMQFVWTDRDPNTVFYVYMYFSELQQLEANESRAFNINFNGNHFYGPLVPDHLNVTVIFTPSGLYGGNFTFSIVRLENSTLPPIINAIEIYTSVDFLHSETDQNDETDGEFDLIFESADAILNIKSSYRVTRNWGGDPCLPTQYIWTGLNCSSDGLDSPRITSLNLSSSGLTGEITSHLSKLTVLESLDLSNNSLTGPVPDFLAQLHNLRILNLEMNKLTGSVPAELIERSQSGSLSLSVGENPDLCASVSCETKTSKKKKSNVAIPIAASVGGLVILMLIAVIIYVVLKRQKKAGSDDTDSLDSKKRHFTYSEVIRITNNFERILGKGGFGTVYHGLTDETTQVAVKMLSLPQVQGNQQSQSEEEQNSMQKLYYVQFQAEVKLLMRVQHANLTSLVGYCNEGNNKALIFEFMANGDLDSHLSGDKNANVLNWERRLQIAVDAAQGLEYLHTGCKPPIVHRDVKTTNILLTERFQAKIADFGLSKVFPSDEDASHVITRVAGTRGYLDPEYATTNRLTEKSDVFSFGVVLLEIITGRPAVSRTHDERIHIIQWVNSMLANGDIKSIAGPSLNGDFETNSVWKAVELAMACVSQSSAKRPNMSQVVTELKNCFEVEIGRRNNNSRMTQSTTDSVELISMNVTTEFTPLPR
ncbi:hypothetical protein TIFTF001_006534 [Ficus carica]|uniref:non-specific serine/threonine protein kinase n=1 Tax=Ficus carica TaxID=3494 RepID=A0AA88A0P6_FICCA|nr:hypothetical protein TIFTF001_006534 [Ficus carica]